MKNFVYSGNVITLTAPYAVASGDGLRVGAIFGVAAGDAESGAMVETALAGVFDPIWIKTPSTTIAARPQALNGWLRDILKTW